MDLSHLTKDDISKALDKKIMKIGKDRLIEDMRSYLIGQSSSPFGRDLVRSVLGSDDIAQLVESAETVTYLSDWFNNVCETGEMESNIKRFRDLLRYSYAILPTFYLYRYANTAVPESEVLMEALHTEIMSIGKDMLIQDMPDYFIYINKFIFGRQHVDGLLRSAVTNLWNSINVHTSENFRSWFDEVLEALFDNVRETESLDNFKNLSDSRDFMLVAFFLYDPSFIATTKWDLIEMEMRYNSEENDLEAILNAERSEFYNLFRNLEAISKALHELYYCFKNPEADRILRSMIPDWGISLSLLSQNPSFGVYRLSNTHPVITQSRVFSDAVDVTRDHFSVAQVSNYMSPEVTKIISKTDNFDKAMEAIAVLPEIIKEIKNQIESVMDSFKDWTTNFLNNNHPNLKSLKRAALSHDIRSVSCLISRALTRIKKGRSVEDASKWFAMNSMSSFVFPQGMIDGNTSAIDNEDDAPGALELLFDICMEKRNFNKRAAFLVEQIRIVYELIKSILDPFKDWITNFLITEEPNLIRHYETADRFHNERLLNLMSRAMNDANEERQFEETSKWYVGSSISSFLAKLGIVEVENTLETFAEFSSFFSKLRISKASAVENTTPETSLRYFTPELFSQPDVF